LKAPKITIVDYGVGNTRSVWHAINKLGYSRVKISAGSSEILEADALILPGVGAFGACIQTIRENGLDGVLHKAVIDEKKPVLGICLGMQIMASASHEDGYQTGLNWIPGEVVEFEPSREFPTPHVGWNNIEANKDSVLFSSLPDSADVYFDHSYHLQCESRYVSSFCDYGAPFVASISIENIHGVQFHPEKSQVNGLRVFRNFFNSIN